MFAVEYLALCAGMAVLSWAAAAAYAYAARSRGLQQLVARRSSSSMEMRPLLPINISRQDLEKLGICSSVLAEITTVAVSPRSSSQSTATRRSSSSSRATDGGAAADTQHPGALLGQATLAGALKAALQHSIPSLGIAAGLAVPAAPSRLSSCSSSAASTPRQATGARGAAGEEQQQGGEGGGSSTAAGGGSRCSAPGSLSTSSQCRTPGSPGAAAKGLQAWEEDVIARYSSLQCPTPAHQAIVERLQRSAAHKLRGMPHE